MLSVMISPRIVQRTQPKKLAAYLRKMVDFVIFTLPPPESSPNQLNSVSNSAAPTSADRTQDNPFGLMPTNCS